MRLSLDPELLVRIGRHVRHLDHHERMVGGRVAGVAAIGEARVGLVECDRETDLDRGIDDAQGIVDGSPRSGRPTGKPFQRGTARAATPKPP